MQTRLFLIVSSLWLIFFCGDCSKGGNNDSPIPPLNPPVAVNEVDFWLTKADQTALLEKQTTVLTFGTSSNTNLNIEIDSTQTFQTIDGFGYTLTGGSAQLINAMTAAQKANLLQELFGTASNAISISYLRLSIGASDLNAAAFTYDDMVPGQTDLPLANFNLKADKAGGTGLIPLLKEILTINPNIKIIAAPWSPPVWMKDNSSFTGGSLQTQYYDVYAKYFVKYIQGMKEEGITIDAITPQNEPLHPGNNPSLLMLATDQRDFIKKNLGPAFRTAGINTRIFVYDHNCDRLDYPLTILNDPEAKQYVDGSAFHMYAGDIIALSQVHISHPDKNVY
ncbi:MAG: glucosylceramidase, partial [Chitinophagaceae bacterium]|nr:glucosylceramidase [Chitinophagaceae bacterium]